MSTTVKTGWLNDKNGDKFAPKTLTSQVQTSDGILIEDKIQTDLDTHASTNGHITSTERTNWNAAKTHADSTHAPSNAEKNQNAFSNVVVGSTTVAADTATDTLTLVAGSNVTITPDATNDKITIAATDTTYSAATQSAAGLLSASDKKKLDGIATGAEVNQNAFSAFALPNWLGDFELTRAGEKQSTFGFIAGGGISFSQSHINQIGTQGGGTNVESIDAPALYISVGGTLADELKAGTSKQSPSTSLIRNSKLVSAEENPTVNGEICWTYE